MNEAPASSAVTVDTDGAGLSPSTESFYAGRVEEIKDGKYHIWYDDGDKRWVTLDQ